MTHVFDGVEIKTLTRGDGIDHRVSVRAATTVAIDLSSDLEGDTIDGVTLAVGDRLLVKNQGALSEEATINTTGGTPAGLGGTYFTIDSTTTAYYVWFDTDNGSADPAPGGKTAIEVDIATGDTTGVIAGKLQAAIDAEGDFVASVLGNVVTTGVVATGVATDAADVNTGLTVLTIQQGRSLAQGQIENGIYEVGSGAGNTFRAEDLITGDDAAYVYTNVQEGTSNKQTQWTCVSISGNATVDTHALEWVQQSQYDYEKGSIFYATSDTNLEALTAPTVTSVLQIDGSGNISWQDRASIDAGLDYKESARVCSRTDIAGTYNASGGTGGTGEFTNVDLTSDVLFDLDGGATSLVIGDRILVKSQDGTSEVSTVDTTGGTPAGLGGTYFTIDSPTTAYYVWFDTDNGSADPAPGGKTAIEVDIATGDTAANIATKLQTVMNGHVDFTAGVATNLVTVTSANVGSVTDTADFDTGLAFATTVQGVDLAVAQRENGIYVVTTAGAAGVIERAADQDESVPGNVSAGNLVFIETGDTCINTQWVVQGDGTLTLNTDPIIWVQFSAQSTLTAGDGIDITANVISADLKANGGLVFESAEIAVDLSASNITGTLAVGDGGTGATTLADNVILLGNGTSPIDDTTLANQARTTLVNTALGDPDWRSDYLFTSEVRDQNDNENFTFTTIAAAINHLDASNQAAGVQEVSTIDTTGGTPAGLSGDYFLLYSDENCYYVWFDTDNSSVDPAVAGFTALEVDIVTGDTAGQIASKLQTAINANADFTAGVGGTLVTVTNVTPAAVSDIADFNTSLSFATTVQGAYNDPILRAKGDDTDIGLSFLAKGSGPYRFLGTASDSAKLRLYEDTDNGNDFVGLAAPEALGCHYTLTLPSDPGQDGYFLQVDGSQNLSFVSSDSGTRQSAGALIATQVSVNTTSFTCVGYFAWKQTEYAAFGSGKVVYEIEHTVKDLDIRVRNVTTSTTLGSDLSVAASGFREFTFTLPTADARLCIEVRKTTGGGGNPNIFGVQMEFNTV